MTMKRIILGITLALAMGSCYEDKGNYDYHFQDIGSVDTLYFTPAAYNGINNRLIIDLNKPGKPDTITQRISLDVKTDGSKENLEYFWYRSYTWDKKARKDTIHNTEGYMDVLVPGDNSITYSIRLEVHDRLNDLSHFTDLTVQTREWFTNSLFVLHGNKPNKMRLGNVEFVGDEPLVTTDAYEKIYAEKDDWERNPFTSSLLLSTCTDYTAGCELVAFNTNGTADIFNAFGLKRKYPNTFAMPESGSPFITKSIINYDNANGMFRAIISKDGRFYVSREFFRFFEPGTYTESEQHIKPEDYRAETGIQTDAYYLFWDSKGKRFLYLGKNDEGLEERNPDNSRDKIKLVNPVLDAHVDFSKETGEFSLDGKQALYAYISYFNNWQQGEESRFLFLDPSTQKVYMYELTPASGGKGKDDAESDAIFEITKHQMLDGLTLDENTPIIYNSNYSLDFLFYAKGGSLYRYNIGNGESSLIYEAEGGYDISVLKFREFDDNYGYWGSLNRYLSIGLKRADEGAVAEIKLTTSGDLDKDWAPRLYEGFENVRDVQFCHEYTFKIDQH